MSLTSAEIRNIAIVGHNGTGKTTLLEHILSNSGAISRSETVDSGKTVSDYTDEEIEKGISIHSSLACVDWNNKMMNFIDTPGTSDFVGEVVSSFRASESAIMVLDARAGVQIETIKLWRRLNTRNMPRIVFINKMDIDRADFQASFSDLESRFNKPCVPVSIPIGSGGSFKGIINLIENKAYLVSETKAAEIPADMTDSVEEYRLAVIEAAAEGDDSLMEKYFEEGTLSSDDIRLGLISGLRENRIVPVLCGSAERDNGIVSLLNFLSIAAPSPSLVIEKASGSDGNEISVPVDAKGSVSAFSFKTSIDQFSGKLSFIKVITGTVTSDTELQNPALGKKEKPGKLYKTLGKKLIEVKELIAGDIGIISKSTNLHTNNTLCSPDIQYIFSTLALPHPIHALTISAVDKKSEDKMNAALHKVTEEDLTFQVNFNKETKENVVSGMGELHINMILERIKEKQKIQIVTKAPKIAYRETITKSSNAEYTHKKQSGGHGQYGRVVININPLKRGEYFSFDNAIKGGAISKGYMQGIEKGLHEAMSEGFLAAYPLVDIGVSIVDGKEHPVDSSEMAFKLAAKGALKTAMEKANVVLLEPIMKLEVFIEDQYLGDILSDLSGKRGRVLGQEDIGGGLTLVQARVPQGEMLKYAIDLKSITSGTGSFELEFDHYEAATGKVADDVIKKVKEEAG
ncbi:MAG: elongation factor G [Spirochaetales bacterium]|nr:elongation factor G [Spirochaetales bacterium]